MNLTNKNDLIIYLNISIHSTVPFEVQHMFKFEILFLLFGIDYLNHQTKVQIESIHSQCFLE